MSTRVYLSKHTCPTTPEENTPVCIRIQLNRATVKALHSRLQHAYQGDDVRLVRRITVLIDLLVRQVPMAVLCERWGLSASCLYDWQRAFLLRGLDSLVYRHGGGRRSKLTAKQKKRLVELLEAGPLVVGCETACWTSILIRVRIWRECGVLSNCQYVCTLLRNLGFSFQKARFVSDHLDAARRQEWLNDTWPSILRAAKRRKGLILFEDEASFAQWGSLSYTWAPKGQQPEVPTSGKRKAYKVFGLIDYVSGRFFYKAHAGRFNSESYAAFLLDVRSQTTQPVVVIQDGARYHTSKAMRAFFAMHADRLTIEQLPAYSPDFNPIEHLWKKVKKEATHLKHFPAFTDLQQEVDRALLHFAQTPREITVLMARYCEKLGQVNKAA